MGVNFRVYFHEQLRKKIGRAKSELSIRETDVKEVLERICDIALELNSEHAKLLKKFRELAERTLKFLQEFDFLKRSKKICKVSLGNFI